MRVIDLTGKKFGRLIVASRAENTTTGKARWKCVCECKREKIAGGLELRSGKVSSCGCLHTESITQHGMSRTPEYRAWIHMKERCINKSSSSYPDYGGRGIEVCAEWLLFENFIKDMGLRPTPKHSIDRINNNKGYSKENCRWASKKDQMNNTRRNKLVVLNGESYTLSQLSEKTGIHKNTLDHRINSMHMEVDDAVAFVKHGKRESVYRAVK